MLAAEGPGIRRRMALPGHMAPERSEVGSPLVCSCSRLARTGHEQENPQTLQVPFPWVHREMRCPLVLGS